MPLFEYVALNPSGKEIKGSIDADSLRGARQKLRTQGLFPTQVNEGKASLQRKTQDVKKIFQSDAVSTKALCVMTRLTATLLGAHIPLVDTLNSVVDQTETQNLRRILTEVREQVEEGSSLARALKNYPRAFPSLYQHLVAAGEASGSLDTVMENLATYLEGQLELRRKVTGALVYPIIMLVFCSLVVIGLLTFVVPTIVDIFTKQGAVLPLPTRIVLGISNFLTGYGIWLIAGIIGAFLFFQWYTKTPVGKAAYHRFLFKIPLFSSMYQRVYTARVAQTLATLLASGVGLLEALDITKHIAGNVHVMHSLEQAKDGVREGRSLAKELQRGNMFPSLFPRMVAIGEQSGRLEAMLIKAGEAYDREVKATVAQLSTIIEPLMIIVVGGIVFFIVLSVLLPMTSMMSLVQR